jgi:hypothetical protein
MPAPLAAGGEIRKITLGHPLLDDYLVFVGCVLRAVTPRPKLRRL